MWILVGTFVDGQTVYGIDSTDENNILYAKLAGQLSSITETTSGQYYKTTDLIPVTTRMPLGGVGASANISEISYGSISNIEVSSVGSGYENGDTITVNNTGTSGTGLSAEIAVTNGGFAPETGSLLEQFRFTLESGTPGGTGELQWEGEWAGMQRISIFGGAGSARALIVPCGVLGVRNALRILLGVLPNKVRA